MFTKIIFNKELFTFVSSSAESSNSLLVSSITSTEAHGALHLISYVSVSSIDSDEAHGDLKLVSCVSVSSIDSVEAHGDLKLLSYISISSITPTEEYGTLNLIPYTVISSIVSSETHGTPKLDIFLEGTLSVTSILSDEGEGVPKFIFFLAVSSLSFDEAYGTLKLVSYVSISSIASSESMGSVVVSSSLSFVITSITSSESIGSPTLSLLSGFLIISSITSLESFGSLSLYIVGNAVVSFDGVNKLIICSDSVVRVNIREDVYSAWKDWVVLDDNSKYLPAISSAGGDPITETQFLGSTFFLENGWKIRPYEGNHTLSLEGNIYTRDGSALIAATIGSYRVVVNTSTSNIVDTVSTTGSSSGLTSEDISDIVQAIWNKTVSGITASAFLEQIEQKVDDNQALILMRMANV